MPDVKKADFFFFLLWNDIYKQKKYEFCLNQFYQFQ